MLIGIKRKTNGREPKPKLTLLTVHTVAVSSKLFFLWEGIFDPLQKKSCEIGEIEQ